MDLVKLAFFAISICPLLIIQRQARAAPLCQDKYSKCSSYDASYCSYYPHIKQQCPKTCHQCGTVYPSSTVPSVMSSHSPDATQNTAVVSQGLQTQTQSTMVASHGLSQTQSTMAVSHDPTSAPKQSTMVVSRVLAQTQSTMVASRGLSQTQSTMAVSHDLTSTHPPTQNNNVLQPSSVGRDNRGGQSDVVRGIASSTDFTQANMLILFGILWNYLI